MYVTNTFDHDDINQIELAGSHLINPTSNTVSAGTCLFYEGDTVQWLYQVTSGVLRLSRLLENGRRQVIAFGYSGDIVGFPANGLHHTDCDVLEDACLKTHRRTALENADVNPEVHRFLLDAALREISAMQDHFMMLGRKSAVEKVASFICVLSNRIGQSVNDQTHVVLSMSRADIADFLGLTTETVCRTLTQLRKSRVIAVENIHTIVVLRPTALLSLSKGIQL